MKRLLILVVLVGCSYFHKKPCTVVVQAPASQPVCEECQECVELPPPLPLPGAKPRQCQQVKAQDCYIDPPPIWVSPETTGQGCPNDLHCLTQHGDVVLIENLARFQQWAAAAREKYVRCRKGITDWNDAQPK